MGVLIEDAILPRGAAEQFDFVLAQHSANQQVSVLPILLQILLRQAF
jgi:predicted O-methyltransferase YrrM